MDIINLHAHPVGASASIWWEDSDGFRYRLSLAFDTTTRKIALPLAVAYGPKHAYESAGHGYWICKLRPANERHNPVYLKADSKKWSPIVTEILRRVSEGDLINKARAERERADAEREEAEAVKREAEIRTGLRLIIGETTNLEFGDALADVLRHASRADLFRLAGALR